MDLDTAHQVSLKFESLVLLFYAHDHVDLSMLVMLMVLVFDLAK